jgi:uncharacterized membrane-anchored protein YhcB (DUF1043 family)
MFQNDASRQPSVGNFLFIVILGILALIGPRAALALTAAENRHQTVLRELELTPQEEKSFWPVYDAYANELLKSFEETAEVAYRLFQVRSKVSDEMADEYTDALLKGELRQAQIHLQYQPQFRSILDARRTARLFQFQRRLHSYMNAEISRDFPLVR